MSRSIPPIDVDNYAAIFTKPIFKNQNGEWYRDVGYTDSVDLIRENIQGAAKSFIAIGYYLKHIKQNELYKEGGYTNIWECAQAEFGLSQSSASRYMDMNDAFSIDGNTPLLDIKYNDFNKSQLQEMLALSDQHKEEIKPEQTVAEIRKIAKEEKKIKEPSEEEIKKFYQIHAKQYDEDRSNLKALLIQHMGKSHAGGNSCGLDYQCSSRGVKIEKNDEITWAHLIKLINLYILPKVKSQSEPENTVEQDSTIDQQLPGQMSVQDYPEMIELSKNDAGLPLLKNSEQRKAWLAAYKSWGLWYRDEHIDVNYYKFDFLEGSRLIVAEYPQRPSYWECKCYDHYYFHLLEKNKTMYGSKGTYDEKYQNSADSETYLVDFLKNLQKRS